MRPQTNANSIEEFKRTRMAIYFFVVHELYRDMSAADIARLRLAFGLVREHIQAQEQGKDVDSSSNPLLDPRSVSILQYLDDV